MYGVAGSISLICIMGAYYNTIDKWVNKDYPNITIKKIIVKTLILPGVIGGAIGFSYGFTNKTLLENMWLVKHSLENRDTTS